MEDSDFIRRIIAIKVRRAVRRNNRKWMLWTLGIMTGTGAVAKLFGPDLVQEILPVLVEWLSGAGP